MIYMHREILGLAYDDPRHVDHINGDTLDNRRANLRAVVRTENALNRHGTAGSSRFRGVCWNKQRSKWRAQVGYLGENHYLGDFEVEADAARTVLEFLAECDLNSAANASEQFAASLTAEEWAQQEDAARTRLLALGADEAIESGSRTVSKGVR